MAKVEDKKKRKYVSNPEVKLKEGKPWRFHFDVDKEVTKEVIKEKKAAKFNPDYGQILNARLRQAYGLPDK